MNTYFTTFFRKFSILFILVLFPLSAFAQMFSIDDPEQRRDRPLGSLTILSAGWELGDYSYNGAGVNDVQRLDFTESIIRLRLDTPGLDISLGFGGAFTGMNDNSYFNVYGRLFNIFPIKREQGMIIGLPIQITTDLKQVRRNDNDTEFQQSSLIVGSGLYAAMRLNQRFSLITVATPNYGFSFSQGSLFGGSLFRTDAKANLLINNFFGQNALSIGYQFDYRVYRVDGDLYDYNYLSHLFTIGIGF
jgi:hypothetical protein